MLNGTQIFLQYLLHAFDSDIKLVYVTQHSQSAASKILDNCPIEIDHHVRVECVNRSGSLSREAILLLKVFNSHLALLWKTSQDLDCLYHNHPCDGRIGRRNGVNDIPCHPLQDKGNQKQVNEAKRSKQNYLQ